MLPRIVGFGGAGLCTAFAAALFMPATQGTINTFQLKEAGLVDDDYFSRLSSHTNFRDDDYCNGDEDYSHTANHRAVRIEQLQYMVSGHCLSKSTHTPTNSSLATWST